MKKSRVKKLILLVFIMVAIASIWAVKSNKSVEEAPADALFPFDVTTKIDLEEFKSHGLPILIDFGADYCPPCREMAPGLKELYHELQGKAIILFVDVGKYGDLADGYPVNVIPTQVLINSDGTPYTPSDKVTGNFQTHSAKESGKHVLTTQEGGLSKDEILAMLKEMGMKDD